MKLLKKFWVVIAIMVLSVLSFYSLAFAYEVPENIRVGLEYKYKEVNSVPIKNNKIELGYLNDDRFVSLCEIRSSSGYNFTPFSENYLLIDKYFSDFEKASDAANDCGKNGYEAAVYVFKDEFSVAILGNSAYSNYRNVEGDIGYSVIRKSGERSVLLKGDETKVLYKDGTFPVVKPIDNNEIINLGDRSYRGFLEVGIYTSKNLVTAVNIVPFEEYLYGVIPSEMPASYEEEALKAQAVAARSYTLTRIGVHKESGYQVCDGINCQVYIGYGNESAKTNEIIDKTKGIIAYYNNAPINAVYCASSGGETEDSENVWTNKVEYLRGVNDIYDPQETWSKTFTAEEIKSILKSKNVDIGDILNIEITKKTDLGRVIEIQITGTSGKKVYSNDSVRSFFRINGKSILSKNFTITKSGGSTQVSNPTYVTNSEIINSKSAYVEGIGNIKLYRYPNYIIGQTSPLYIEKNGKVFVYGTENNTVHTNTGGNTAFVINGKGNGHGVGMSQKGANSMAKQGFDYEKILHFYYTDIEIK